MISFWAMVLFLIGDSACSSSKMMAKEGSCVTVNLTLSDIGNSGYIVWLKDAVWNDTAADFDGTIVHSLKPDKPAASEFENRVSVCSTGDLYKLTISNLRLNDSGKYMVRYYDKADPPYKLKKSSAEMSLEVQKNPCQVSVTGPELVQMGAEVILRCSTVGPCQNSPEWRRSGSGPASSEVSNTQGAKTAQLRFKADWSHDGVEFSCWPSPSNDACASRNITLAVEYAPKEVRITASRTLEGIHEGAAVNLTCEVQSSNPSERSYSWYRNHTVLLETGQVLRFPAVRPKDRGSYHCQALNSVASEDSPEVTITVHYGPRGTKIKASCCEGGVKAGKSLTLTCETDARPEPGYTWFRTITEPGGERGPGTTEVPVPSNGRSGGQYLRFSLISAGDAGEYTCQAKNIISAQKSTALRVDVLCECCI
ncbi:B-cell receptor CD22-like [Anguilla rostrata]|uniref:B-cell receptor CD22-like n=1 Tax=Anguilla rostrata TaxID=7938 RepID=UPI0030D2450B